MSPFHAPTWIFTLLFATVVGCFCLSLVGIVLLIVDEKTSSTTSADKNLDTLQ